MYKHEHGSSQRMPRGQGHAESLMWWCILRNTDAGTCPVIPVFGRLRQEEEDFKACPGYTMRLLERSSQTSDFCHLLCPCFAHLLCLESCCIVCYILLPAPPQAFPVGIGTETPSSG